MQQYSSNPQNIQKKKRIQTPPLQAELSAFQAPLTVQSKHSVTEGEENNLIHQQLQSELLNAQKASYISDASNQNSGLISSGLPSKRKRTLTVLGQALEKEKLLKQAKADTRIGKSLK